MAGTPLQRPIWGVTVTVPSSAATLLSLIQAKSPTAFYGQLQGSCRSYNLQMDPASSGDIYVGDENVSSSNCGIHLQVGGGFLDRASVPGMAPIGSVFVVSAGGTETLNVLVFGE